MHFTAGLSLVLETSKVKNLEQTGTQ